MRAWMCFVCVNTIPGIEKSRKDSIPVYQIYMYYIICVYTCILVYFTVSWWHEVNLIIGPR